MAQHQPFFIPYWCQGRAMDMLRLYARTLKVVEPIAEANQHKAGPLHLFSQVTRGVTASNGVDQRNIPFCSSATVLGCSGFYAGSVENSHLGVEGLPV